MQHELGMHSNSTDIYGVGSQQNQSMMNLLNSQLNGGVPNNPSVSQNDVIQMNADQEKIRFNNQLISMVQSIYNSITNFKTEMNTRLDSVFKQFNIEVPNTLLNTPDGTATDYSALLGKENTPPFNVGLAGVSNLPGQTNQTHQLQPAKSQVLNQVVDNSQKAVENTLESVPKQESNMDLIQSLKSFADN